MRAVDCFHRSIRVEPMPRVFGSYSLNEDDERLQHESLQSSDAVTVSLVFAIFARQNYFGLDVMFWLIYWTVLLQCIPQPDLYRKDLSLETVKSLRRRIELR